MLEFAQLSQHVGINQVVETHMWFSQCGSKSFGAYHWLVVMKGMKSNCWSAETLVRGIRKVGDQPATMMANLDQDQELAQAKRVTCQHVGMDHSITTVKLKVKPCILLPLSNKNMFAV